MIISFDTRTLFLSRVNNYRNEDVPFSNLGKKFFSSKSGPQNFVSDLIHTIEKNNLAETTFNFINSDIHLLNSGFYSFFWRNFKLKEVDKVILRLDGIGIDTENDLDNKINKNKMVDLLDKGSNVIYQSKFCKNCFNDIFGSLTREKIIYNGAINMPIISPESKQLVQSIKLRFKNKYFSVAGRYTNRKRIKEIIKEFNENDMGNLVVLSNVPSKDKIKNERIIYLNLLNPLIARNIISNSIALIHFDRYDWCPNIVISAIQDGIPVICSNFGGTPEIVGKSGLIIKEFPENLPHSIFGINTAKNANFPSKLFIQNIIEVWNNGIEIEKTNFYKINKIANEYVDFAREII